MILLRLFVNILLVSSSIIRLFQTIIPEVFSQKNVFKWPKVYGIWIENTHIKQRHNPLQTKDEREKKNQRSPKGEKKQKKKRLTQIENKETRRF